jgi:hypothetical protein
MSYFGIPVSGFWKLIEGLNGWHEAGKQAIA